jgi:hypothetical protein
MKQVVFVALLSVVLTACSSINGVQAIVVRDCTGTYIRVSEKDYLVCNNDLLEKKQTGDTVRVRFQSIQNCPRLDTTIVCMMYHEHHGLVKLKKVNDQQ